MMGTVLSQGCRSLGRWRALRGERETGNIRG